ncbi:MAG TPA: hypothetical protein VGR26_15295 [Acidimicrobiales bacterium]|nr:hypothetical protein [Acidimicrobiales bacterium]
MSLQLLASGVTTRNVALAVVTSLMVAGVGRLQAWPLWAIVLAMVVPAMPVFASPAVQLRRHDGALALFYLLVLAQTGHVLEHLSQVTQLHVLHHTGDEAHGVFGALDVEWVHFIWNAAILLAVVLVLRHYRRNLWLWFALAFAGWHQVEHTYIMSVYLQTAQMGTPGLLSAGGALGGGLPLRRPDLHLLYNVLETTPLVLAFLHQVGKLVRVRQVAVVAESPVSTNPRHCLLNREACAWRPDEIPAHSRA